MQTMAAAAAVFASSTGGGAATAARVASLAAFRQAAADIWARDRLRGFYSGIVPNTVQVTGAEHPLALMRGCEVVAADKSCHELTGHEVMQPSVRSGLSFMCRSYRAQRSATGHMRRSRACWRWRTDCAVQLLKGLFAPVVFPGTQRRAFSSHTSLK